MVFAVVAPDLLQDNTWPVARYPPKKKDPMYQKFIDSFVPYANHGTQSVQSNFAARFCSLFLKLVIRAIVCSLMQYT